MYLLHYYIAKEYSGKTKIKALKDRKAYVKSDLSGAFESYRKRGYFQDGRQCSQSSRLCPFEIEKR